jgi:uncharacterized membrane protein
MIVFKLFHLLAAVLWVGGMFFAYVVLRPAAVEVLQPPERLRLWSKVFQRFFTWVWGAIGVILVTGFYLVYQYGGMAHVSHHIHVMLLLGIVMTVIYAYVFFGLYIPLSLHVAKERWKEAGEILGRIRKMVAINLSFGVLTICVAVIGYSLA